MLKSFSLPFISPTVTSRTVVKNKAVATHSSRGSAKVSRAAVKLNNQLALPIVSMALSAVVLSLLVLQVYWVNNYAGKGIALTEIQNSIQQRTELQKKLLYQQAQLNSSITFADVSKTGLVPVTTEEYLTTTQLTAR